MTAQCALDTAFGAMGQRAAWSRRIQEFNCGLVVFMII